jgi:hypothetical protein
MVFPKDPCVDPKSVSLAKTSAATKNCAALGREGLNTSIAFAEHLDFGGQEPCACAAHIYIKDGEQVSSD